MNASLFNALFSLAHKTAFLDGLIIFFAKYLAYLLVLGFFILLFRTAGARLKILYFCEAALSVILARGILTEVIRYFYAHPRPFDALGITPSISEAGPSFPSGHMTFFFALAGTISYFNKKWGMVYFLAGVFMGAARVFAGVHWPYDILGGIIIGLASAAFIHWLLKTYREKLSEPRAPEILKT